MQLENSSKSYGDSAEADEAFEKILAGIRAKRESLTVDLHAQQRVACDAFNREIDRRIATFDFYIAALRDTGLPIDVDAERYIKILNLARDAYATLRFNPSGVKCPPACIGGSA